MARPLRPNALAPRCTAFHDGDRSSGGDEFEAYLVKGVWWNALLAEVAYGSDVDSWQHASIVVMDG